MTTMAEMAEMAQLEKHSKEWFEVAFEGVNAPDYIKVASAKICQAYNITGQCDPGYIANVINNKVNEKQTVCPKTSTGEHCMVGPEDTCQWCWQSKS